MQERIRISLVSLVKAHHPFEFKNAIEKSFDLISASFDSKIVKVAVKPNLCYYWDYSTGETTDPKLVVALVDLLRERISTDLNISIVESDASAMKCQFAFPMLGYQRMAREEDVSLVNLTEDTFEEVQVKVAGRTFSFSVPHTIKNADLFINMPKMKLRPHTKITCALKNIYGCNPYSKKYRYHPHLDEAIVALNKIMKPDLCLVDGIIALGDYPRRLGLIMASKDPVAVDSVVARIGGISPKSIGHLALAEKEGVGRTDYVNAGEDIDYFAQRFPHADWKGKIRSRLAPATAFALGKLGLSGS